MIDAESLLGDSAMTQLFIYAVSRWKLGLVGWTNLGCC